MRERTTSWQTLREIKAVKMAARRRRMGLFMPGDEGSPIANETSDLLPSHHLYIFKSAVDLSSNNMHPLSYGDVINGDDGEFGMLT